MRTKRSILLLAGLALMCAASQAQAQDFPNRPIRFVVGFPPGGSVDVLARAVGTQASKGLGQSVVVENHAGASTNVASDLVAKARPDGYTVLVASDSVAINKSLFRTLGFDPVTSFQPVTLAILAPQILAVRSGLGVSTPADYVSKVREAPGKISVAITGKGTIGHLISERINLSLGLSVNHVPYTGGAPAARDLIGGHVDGLWITLPAVTPQIRAGSMVPVAIASPKRSPAIANVPTFAETVMPGLSLDSWQGFLVPAGTPRPIVDRLNREIVAALRSEMVTKPLVELGFEIVAGTPEEFAAVIAADVTRFGEIVRAAKIQVD